MKRLFCIILPIITIAYSLVYASLGGYVGNESAMSTIGLEHHFLFVIWGLLTFFTLASNLAIGFKNINKKFYIIPLLISAAGMTLTLACDFDYDKHTEYMLHCIGSLTFSAIMGITVFVLFILSKKYLFAIIAGGILILDLILLLIYKETALIELMPIFAGYILLAISNTRKEKETIEAIR